MRPPADADIPAPGPPTTEWVNVALLRIDRLLGRHAILVEFWDFARVNSLRTLPYLRGWHERYVKPASRSSACTRRDTASAATPRPSRGRLAARDPHPVALDPQLAIWRLYGTEAGRVGLFDRRGPAALHPLRRGRLPRLELAIQECCGSSTPRSRPEPLDSVRPEDEPGVLLEPQTVDIRLPGDRERLELVRDWRTARTGSSGGRGRGAASFDYRGRRLRRSIRSWQGGGVYETDGTVVAESPGVRLHGVQFTPPPPAPSESPSEA